MRWRLVQELATGDRRVRELVAALGEPQSLVSYHLRQLRDAGLVASRRSSHDARDTYYRLDLASCSAALSAAAAAVHPGLGSDGTALTPGSLTPGPQADGEHKPSRRVLFVCTGNSGRSPIAQALLARRAGPRVQAASAGTHPKPLHPDAVAVMRDRYRLDISGHRPVDVASVAAQPFDCVISLCDKAREACPDFAGAPGRVHWSLPDPASGEGGLAGYAAFERTASELDARIQFLLPVLAVP